MARLTHPNPRLLLTVVGALALAACVLALMASHKPAEATFPGENGRIVLEGNPTCTSNSCFNDMDIYSVDPATAEVSNLTDTTTDFIEDATHPTWLISDEHRPRWSPDGEKVLFFLDRYLEVCERDQDFCHWEEYTGPDPAGLYTMNPDGSGKTRIPNGLGLYAWSPGGKKIAGWAGWRGAPEEGGFDRLRTMNADGSGSKRVFVPRRLGYVEEAPAWSRDGKKLAFVRYEWFDSKGEYIPFVHAVKADGTGHRKFAAQCSGGASGLSWTPDGKRLLFQCAEIDADPAYDYDIFSAKPDGSQRRNLTDTPSTEGNVAWEVGPQVSPDGEKIGFVKSSGPPDDPRYNFHTMNADGSAPKEAFGFAAGDSAAWVWSPDSEKIAFVRLTERPSGYSYFISTINVDGSERKNIHVPNLTGGYPGITDLDWQPLP